jgi:DNA methylase
MPQIDRRWTAHDLSRLQSIMSRTGSFPVYTAIDLLNENAREGALVCDPFCGKGTTLLAARALGMNCLGLDIAPEAEICSRAKVAQVNKAEVIRYLEQLPTGPAKDVKLRRDIGALLHPQTIRLLIPIRNRLMTDIAKESEPGCASVVFAALLGILHGHASFSLSVPSAHAFAMAPSYVRKYAKENNLARPIRDILACLRAKVDRCIPEDAGPRVTSKIIRGSAYQLLNHFPSHAGAVDVILTSPPYLSAQTYYKDNWLRHWLLDSEDTVSPSDYLQTSSVVRYSTVVSTILEQCSKLLKPMGRLICIAGDVKLPNRASGSSAVVNTAAILRDAAVGKGFSILAEGLHTVPTKRRYLNSLRQSNGHNGSDRYERYFVAAKNK